MSATETHAKRWTGPCGVCGREREIGTRPMPEPPYLKHGGRPVCDECSDKPHKPPTASGLDEPQLPPATTSASMWQLSDLGNAERFVHEHGDYFRYVPELGWLHWDGRRWDRDTTGAVMRASKITVRRIKREAAETADKKLAEKRWQHGHRSEQRPRLEAMVALAATEAEVVVTAEQLDAHPDLLTVGNGTVDLRTGELRPHEPADLITRATTIDYDRSAGCARWARFLAEIADGDVDLVGYLQRLVGYTLTGHTSEQMLAVFYGTGCNGKTTLVNVLQKLHGDHAVTAPFDTFTRGRNDRGPRDDLARLRGARLVTAAESGEGRRLDEATVKEITGGDRIAARPLYREYFEFRPAFTLLLTTNHRPRVDADDEAIWRRLQLVPFEQSFEGREDRDLEAMLEAELPGILTWAVLGAMKWYRLGLDPPATVRAATADYRNDEDAIGQFLADVCTLDPDARTIKTQLRGAYERWCGDNGEQPLTAREFGVRLARHGIRRGGAGRSQYVGVRTNRVTVETPESVESGPAPVNLPHAHAQREVSGMTVTDRHSGTDALAGAA